MNEADFRIFVAYFHAQFLIVSQHSGIEVLISNCKLLRDYMVVNALARNYFQKRKANSKRRGGLMLERGIYGLRLANRFS